MFSKLSGVHVPHRKNTAKMPAVRMPIPKSVTIPMNMHIGAPSNPIVKVGDEVKEGDLIASAGNGLSVPQFASISGKVISCDPSKIVIEA
jgi:electron transport complex protein RnfC